MRTIPVRGVLCALLLLLPPLGFLVSRGEARTPSALLSALTGRQNPTASFTFSPSAPQVGQVVTFDGSGSSGSFGGDIATWQWTFHDATTASGQLVTKTYTAPGTYSVWLTVTDFDNLTHTTVDEVTISAPPEGPPEVTPKGTAVSRTTSATSSQVFNVRNTGTTSTTYTLTATCTGQATSCGVPQPSTLTLAGGQSGGVTVSFQAAASAGTGQVRLRAATPLNVADEGWFALTVTAPPLPAQSLAPLDSATAIPLIERDLCLTVATGDNAAYECGDLRIVHPLPSVRTMNKERAPVLLYNSQHAEPNPLVAAHVQFSPTGGQPTAIRAILTVSGTTPAISFSRTWTPPSGTTWAAGQQRRIVMGHDPAISGSDRLTTLPTGVYPYTLSVEVQAGGQWTNQAPRSGSLLVVNRKSHPSRAASILGIPGWWVAGVEELHYLDVNRTQILWVGGDGSARVYTRGSGQTEWSAPRLEWIGDRITSETTGGVTTYVRHLPGGVTVRFNYAGQHVSTVNRLGHETTFEYSSGLLTALYVHSPGGGVPYFFNHSDPSQVWIIPPSLELLADRSVTIGLSNGRVSFIRDPGFENNQPSIGFGYLGTTNRISQRTDRRNHTTYFTYDEGQKLRSARRQMGQNASAADIALGFFAHESKGSARAVRSDSVFTYVKGPRADVTVESFVPATDTTVTTFWIDRFGSPWRIRNALHDSTVLRRGDSNWPARVTWMRDPGGLVTTATYNTRGNVDSTQVLNPYDDGRNPTTRYRYADPAWPDFATRIVAPEGDSVMLGYDTAGNRVWQQDARGDSTRTVFRYYHNGLLKASDGPLTKPDSLVYGLSSGNLAEVHSPLGFVTRYYRDSAGRDTLIVTPTLASQGEVRQSIEYDLLDRVVRSTTLGPALGFPTESSNLDFTPEESVVVVNEYDPEGNLTRLTRRFTPDPRGIDSITTRWVYDAANRRTVEIAPDATPANSNDNPRETTEYDRSGNVVRITTRRDHQITLKYDALDRMWERTLPSITTQSFIQPFRGNVNFSAPLYVPGPEGEFTRRNVDPPASFTFGADIHRFQYDTRGNLRSAVNDDASVSRTYYSGGALKSETQKVRTYHGADTSQHVYTLQYAYDRNGRRTHLTVPQQFGGGSAVYAYHSASGALTGVTDPRGYGLGFEYDREGRLARFNRGGGAYEKYFYDDDGRRIKRESLVHDPFTFEGITYSGSGTDTLVYDARGKIIGGITAIDTVRMAYTGLGALAFSHRHRYGHSTQPDMKVRERYHTDGLANQTSSSQQELLAQFIDNTDQGNVWEYETHTGRLLSSASYHNGGSGSMTTGYDAAGNTTVNVRATSITTYHSNPSELPGIVDELTHSYYDASQRLRFSSRQSCVAYLQGGTVKCDRNYPPDYTYRSVFEEHRYDALGRRVLVRDRNSDGSGYVRRFVWDGDQMLGEIRRPGGDYDSVTTMEADTGRVPIPSTYYPNNPLEAPYLEAQYGRVLYTHAMGIDQPVSVIRMDHSHFFPQPITVVPHLDWRGQYENGSFGARAGYVCQSVTMQNWNSINIIDRPDTTFVHCAQVEWPGGGSWMTLGKRRTQQEGPLQWFGSLLQNQQDASGTMYRRNRFYDPQTGRFTQEDPIGLAGGINLYGFANGDPVTYSDPYGLSPLPDCRKAFQVCVATAQMMSAAWAQFPPPMQSDTRAYGDPVVHQEPSTTRPHTSEDAADGVDYNRQTTKKGGSRAPAPANTSRNTTPRSTGRRSQVLGRVQNTTVGSAGRFLRGGAAGATSDLINMYDTQRRADALEVSVWWYMTVQLLGGNPEDIVAKSRA